MAMILLARERIQIESFTDNRADKMNKPLSCGTRIYPILKKSVDPDHLANQIYSKTCLKQPLSKIPKIGFQDQLSLHAGQNYCKMLQVEHSAILSTFINLPFVTKIVVLSILSGRLRQVLLYANSWNTACYM